MAIPFADARPTLRETPLPDVRLWSIIERYRLQVSDMTYRIEISDLAESELMAIRVFDRRRIVEQVREQLTHQPATETRNRKRLETAVPAFDHTPPVWELRIGEYRVFYDVDQTLGAVFVRAVRRKEPGQTTEDVIQ
jgi:mRNA-degrading endonuclease RelE of RelBE toxin-antitoxin system